MWPPRVLWREGYPQRMSKPTDDEAPEEGVEATLVDAEVIKQFGSDQRAQQHEYFRKRDVWPRGPKR